MGYVRILSFVNFNILIMLVSFEWWYYIYHLKALWGVYTVQFSPVPKSLHEWNAKSFITESLICLFRTAGEVCAGIITKCLNSPRTKTKEKAFEILMLYIEAEKHEIVQVSEISNSTIISVHNFTCWEFLYEHFFILIIVSRMSCSAFRMNWWKVWVTSNQKSSPVVFSRSERPFGKNFLLHIVQSR